MLATDALSNLVFAVLLMMILAGLKLRRSSGDDRRVRGDWAADTEAALETGRGNGLDG
jgi:hypothetical protein